MTFGPEAFRPSSAPAGRLASKEVHLWSLDLRPERAWVEQLRRLLTPAEVARADRFVFPRHRRRFAVRRGVLRLLAGSYLGLDPAAVRFGEGEKGKPYVEQDGMPARDRLHFNLTDSRDLAVYAFTRSAELGVDVEILRPIEDADQMAKRFFSAEESRDLRRAPAGKTSESFLNCWTRKEAYIKAIGEGLSEPLDRFRVTLLPDDPVRFVHVGGDERRAADWALHHLVPEPGAVGALALEGEGWRITQCYRWVFDLWSPLPPKPEA